MTWTLTDNLTDYLATAGGFLRADPVRNTIQLVATETLRARGLAAFSEVAPLFGWWRSSDGEITAALLHTPPYPVLLTRLPPGAARPLAEALVACRRTLPGVTAEAGDAAEFAACWSALTGTGGQEFRRSRLYELGRLIAPSPPPPGAARAAAAADRDLIGPWLVAFAAEIDDIASRDPAEVLDDRFSYQGLTLWETGGTAVALAGANRPAAGTVRIGPVYTPPGHRRRGYGSAVTAAVSQAALDAGAGHVVLFTDLANPASNSVYLRLGYRPVEDRVVLRFGS